MELTATATGAGVSQELVSCVLAAVPVNVTNVPVTQGTQGLTVNVKTPLLALLQVS